MCPLEGIFPDKYINENYKITKRMVYELILTALLNFITYMWSLFLDWLFVFISPYRKLDILWIIIPIWINWFFTEFFQESKGTRIGNAITNGAIMLWIGVDLLRYTIRDLYLEESMSVLFFSKIGICILVVLYGIFIITKGLKKINYVKFIGRVRETTYVLLMFAPIIYGIVDFSLGFFLGFFIFFPVWYYLIELIEMKLNLNDDEEESNNLNFPNTSNQFSKDLSFNDKNLFN